MSVKITSPKNSSIIEGPFTLRLEFSEKVENKELALYVDGKKNQNVPFSNKIKVNGLPLGKVSLTVAAVCDGNIIHSNTIKLLSGKKPEDKEIQEDSSSSQELLSAEEVSQEGEACLKCGELLKDCGCGGGTGHRPPHKEKLTHHEGQRCQILTSGSAKQVTIDDEAIDVIVEANVSNKTVVTLPAINNRTNNLTINNYKDTTLEIKTVDGSMIVTYQGAFKEVLLNPASHATLVPANGSKKWYLRY